MIEEVFIELLQVAVGRRACLSRTPSEEEWEKVYEMAVKHAMLGVCFYAIQRLNVQEQVPSHQLLFEWYHVTEAIKHTNVVQDEQCRKLRKELSEAGIRSSILKGQGIAAYYGKELSQYRQPGDIDVFVDCGLEGALKFAHDIGKETSNWGYKHMHLDIFNDTEVEIHYHVEVLLNLFKNRKLQRWFEAHKEDALGHIDGVDLSEKKELATPTVEFNMFYILLHIYRHFLFEGVGLRQLMDYYFVLQKGQAETDRTMLNSVLKEFGMTRFARGIMWVMQEVFALDKKYMYCEPLESEGRFILGEVMAGGNFGSYDERIAYQFKGKVYNILAICEHGLYLVQHYPSEVIWSPVWFIWLKCWKWQKRLKLGKLRVW